VIISEMYSRCRWAGSEDMWFWLAMIIRGRSQQERTRSGLDKASAAIVELKLVQAVSQGFFIQIRLSVAIRRL